MHAKKITHKKTSKSKVQPKGVKGIQNGEVDNEDNDALNQTIPYEINRNTIWSSQERMYKMF